MQIFEAGNIVEAHQRHLARHRHATPAQFRKRSKRHRIVGNEHCGKAGLCQQLGHRPCTTLTREFADGHPWRQALLGQSRAVAVLTFVAGPQLGRPADQGNIAMAEVQKMLGGQARTTLVIAKL